MGLRATKGKSFTCTLHVHIAKLAKVACTSALLFRRSCDLLATAGQTHHGDDTPTLNCLAKSGPTALAVRGLSRHLAWKKTQLRMSLLRDPTRQGGVVPTLFCAGCSRQRSRCTAGTLAVRASAMVCCTYASAFSAMRMARCGALVLSETSTQAVNTM